jgi:hypothetical protein
VNRQDMMLICMRRHRHLASRYRGSTAFGAVFDFFWGDSTGVSGARERDYTAGANHGSIPPLTHVIRLKRESMPDPMRRVARKRSGKRRLRKNQGDQPSLAG